jgi:hypothetical protein
LRADLAAADSEHEFNVQLASSPVEAPTADERRFPRVPYQACLQAVVFPPPGEEQGSDAGTPCQLLTRDISRAGINLLHKQQLYPGQKIDVVLPDGQERRLAVIWCRRLGVGCYSAGCRFVKAG